MKKAMQVVSGVFLILGAIWGGAAWMHYTPEWTEFAAFSTAALMFMAGGGLLAAGLINKDMI